MAEDTLITPLNFNDTLTGKLWSDKKNGLDISLGHISGLPADLAEIPYNAGDIAISLMERGMGQRQLDMACQKLASDCKNRDFTLLLTKSDFPFDARWYMIGDLAETIAAAKLDTISLPFSSFLYDEMQEHITKYQR